MKQAAPLTTARVPRHKSAGSLLDCIAVLRDILYVCMSGPSGVQL